MSEIVTAGILVIGDEILSGRTQDRNVAQVASWLNVQGIRLAEVRVVPDVESAIVEAVNALSDAIGKVKGENVALREQMMLLETRLAVYELRRADASAA